MTAAGVVVVAGVAVWLAVVRVSRWWAWRQLRRDGLAGIVDFERRRRALETICG